MKNPAHLKNRDGINEGRQDRDVIHEAWLTNILSMLTPLTPSHNPYIVA